LLYTGFPKNQFFKVNTVDPFLRRPVGRGLSYFRLHGRPTYPYHYRCSETDLDELEGMFSKVWPNGVLFKNDAMAHDARYFRKRMNHP